MHLLKRHRVQINWLTWHPREYMGPSRLKGG